MNIFVAKLSFDTESEDLRKVFEQYGNVTSANVITDKFTGRSKGFGFVEMDDDGEAQSAIDALNDTDLDGRTIVVKKAEPRGDRGGGRRGGGGGYGGGRGGGGYGQRWRRRPLVIVDCIFLLAFLADGNKWIYAQGGDALGVFFCITRTATNLKWDVIMTLTIV